MQISERIVPQGIILDLVGDLTYANRAAFKTAVEKVKQAGCRHLIVNLEQVRFVDSAGLGLLVLVSQNLKLLQTKVSMLKPQRSVSIELRDSFGQGRITAYAAGKTGRRWLC